MAPVAIFHSLFGSCMTFTRFLAFYSNNPSGLHDGETPAKWQSRASFATHPSAEPEWPPKLLTRFSS